MPQGHEKETGDFAEMTAFERYGVKTSENANMHSEHWLTSTAFSPFCAPLLRGYSPARAALLGPSHQLAVRMHIIVYRACVHMYRMRIANASAEG